MKPPRPYLSGPYDEISLTMDSPLRILHLEDNAVDAMLVYETLRVGDINTEVTVVSTRGDYVAAVEKGVFDVILADYQLLCFDGLEALAILRASRRSDVPFLFVTGSLGEELAVEALKKGATDFLLKDRLFRLVPAVNRAVAEAATARLRRQTEQALRDSEERLRLANLQLARHVAELRAANVETRASRRAALNLMEDALLARRELEDSNNRLRAEIAERKQVEEALRKSEADYRSLFEAAGVGNVEIEIDSGRFLRANRKFCELTGYSAAELLEDMIFPQLIHPDDREANLTAMMAFMRGAMPAYEFEKRYVCKYGAVIWVHVACALVCDAEGRPVRIIGVVQDITERKTMEEALIDADRRKDEFLAMLAHELRNPLAPIRNAVQLLQLQGADMAQRHRVRDILERNVDYMVRLIDDLLDVSRITLGKVSLRKERVELTTVMERAVETCRPFLDARRHTLNLRLPCRSVPLLGDPVRLAQIFANLLNNAAKYTAEGGRIEFTADIEEKSAVLRVQDNGIGIRADLLPQIFDLFRQDERGLDRSQGGLGIGLTLVKSLVELHGGTVAAHSDGLEQGAVFTVRLPCFDSAHAPTMKTGTQPADRQTETGLQVLVVDDNHDFAESIAMLLRMFGHIVETAADGTEGLQAAQHFDADVIVLDIGLPGMDGYELAMRLRCAYADRPLLIIALSGYGRAEDKMRAAAAGIDHYLVKPADTERLQDVIAAYRCRLPS
ncbi:MAG: response regulator [Gammaproteobacteria bacterium]